jgi:integrase
MLSKNREGYYTRNGVIYVQGSVDGVFKRYSTGRKATKLNLLWFKKHGSDEFIKIHNQKNKIVTVSSNFAEYAQRSLEMRKFKISEHTFKEYTQMFEVRIKPFFKNYDLTDIKRIDLQQWQNNLIESKKISGKRINNIRSLFNTILEDARKDELIEKNYFTLVDRVREEKPEVNPFSLEEVLEILKHSKGWEKNFFQIAFFTGLRTGELIGLRWEDINFVTKKISIRRSVRKGTVGNVKTINSVRTIDMLPLVEKALIEQKFNTYMKNSFVFLNEQNENYYDGTSIRKNAWQRTLRAAKLDYRTLYQTRHTFASIMISKGEDMLWVSNMLGHGNLNITLSKYAKYCKTDTTARAQFLDGVDTFQHSELHTTTVQENSKNNEILEQKNNKELVKDVCVQTLHKASFKQVRGA